MFATEEGEVCGDHSQEEERRGRELGDLARGRTLRAVGAGGAVHPGLRARAPPCPRPTAQTAGRGPTAPASPRSELRNQTMFRLMVLLAGLGGLFTSTSSKPKEILFSGEGQRKDFPL